MYLFLIRIHFLLTPAEKPQQEEGSKRKRGPAKAVCPFAGATALQTLRDEVLGAVSDIEQLVTLGRKTHACPYYATRLAIPPSQVSSRIRGGYW